MSAGTFLDDLTPSTASVGHGELGLHGDLGYEGRAVEVFGRRFEHALSSHAPATLTYDLAGRYAGFSAFVALNDDVAAGGGAADFLVLVDGELAGIARDVRPRELPRPLQVDVREARVLTLVVSPRRWEWCHSVWIEPLLTAAAQTESSATIVDCLDRCEIVVPTGLREAGLCIATVGSPGYEDWVDDLLGSVCANGQCPDALLAIFFLGESAEIDRIAAKYQAVVVRCRPRRPMTMACKAVLYSAAQVIPASRFLCLDADMLVLDDLQPVVASLDALPPDTILTCREAIWLSDLGTALQQLYREETVRAIEMLGLCTQEELQYPFVVNDGLFAGSAAALRSLDGLIREVTNAPDWVDDPAADCPWRNQFIFNVALARGRCGVELDPRYNVQLMVQSAEWSDGFPAVARSFGRRVAVAHFNGSSKSQRAAWQDRIRISDQPLAGAGGGNAYDEFLVALRRWIGQEGLVGMAWSYYGTTDGTRGKVADPSCFPLLAALHFLMRSNGCERILETGTARGVSAACLASAVAHRANPVVVTLDPVSYPERETLWAELPPRIRRCIVPRRIDGLKGMRWAIEQGERYHAAVLDSLHTAEHVLQEFELARQLVCPGGLILVHDPIYRSGTVDQALRQIAAEGYGVVRLWTADEGVREDDHLGLALIENRRGL